MRKCNNNTYKFARFKRDFSFPGDDTIFKKDDGTDWTRYNVLEITSCCYYITQIPNDVTSPKCFKFHKLQMGMIDRIYESAY